MQLNVTTNKFELQTFQQVDFPESESKVAINITLQYNSIMKTQNTGANATISFRMQQTTKEKLEVLARHTRRTKSFLANEAIESYVNRELDIIEGINRGLADMEAGRVTSHEEAMKQIRSTIKQAQSD